MSFELKKVCAVVGAVVETEALALGELVRGQLAIGAILLISAALAAGVKPEWVIGADANGNGGRPKKKK